MKIIVFLMVSSLGPYRIVHKTIDSLDYEYIVPYGCFDEITGRIICDPN